MKTKKGIVLLALAGLLLLSLSVAGCAVRVRGPRLRVRAPVVRVRVPRVHVRVRPPAARVEVRRACPGGSYWKTGRWQWNGRRYVWLRGGCKRYPTRYRGCFWVRGRWVASGGGWRWYPGRWRCRR
ncbi:MAG: hypothetical protein J7M25_14315 [Deltaproteobacteria bacterium]|nr:hypothetical protein [Deltaproteobacteria bacterium]